MATKAKVEEQTEEKALATISPELQKLYTESASVGAQNLNNAQAFLKVHSAGRSKNELADGGKPNDGWFFYTPTQEQFEEVEVHVLTISKGFRTKSMEEGKKDVYTQIMAGVIVNEGKLLPFLMYFTGGKLSRLWEFGKQIGVYTRLKPVPLPMFSMTVRMKTEDVKTKFGSSWVVNFEIERGMNGFPLVVENQNVFIKLREAVSKAEDSIAAIIESTSIQETPKEENLLDGTGLEEEPEPTEPGNENINPDDIPF